MPCEECGQEFYYWHQFENQYDEVTGENHNYTDRLEELETVITNEIDMLYKAQEALADRGINVYIDFMAMEVKTINKPVFKFRTFGECSEHLWKMVGVLLDAEVPDGS